MKNSSFKENGENLFHQIKEDGKNLLHQFNDELFNNNLDAEGNPHPQKGNLNLKKLLLAIVSLFLPIVGVIAFFVYKKKNNIILGKLTLTCAIVGALFNVVFSSPESDSYSDDSSYSYEGSYSSSSRSYSNNSYSFSSERDVRTFLTSHTFVDDSGDRIEFRNMGNSLIMNGTTMTSSLRVSGVSSTKATLAFTGPYGNSRFVLIIEDGEAGIMDYSDYSTYKCRL